MELGFWRWEYEYGTESEPYVHGSRHVHGIVDGGIGYGDGHAYERELYSCIFGASDGLIYGYTDEWRCAVDGAVHGQF